MRARDGNANNPKVFLNTKRLLKPILQSNILQQIYSSCAFNDNYFKQVKDLEQASKVKNPMQFPSYVMSSYVSSYVVSVSRKVKLFSGSWGRESSRG